MSSIAKEEDNNPCCKEEVTDKHIMCTYDIKKLHITRTEQVDVDVCANCGKEGSDLNICNKCKAVKYCNAACKKKHRIKHKKKCERRVAELHDEQLFIHPPKKEDCPICFLPLPLLGTGSKYKVCCGKSICSGCIHAVRLRDNGVGLCPFCRTPAPDSEKGLVKQTKKRVEVGDAGAMFNLGYFFSKGSYGLPQNHDKALELYRRAGELGYAKAYDKIGYAYLFGAGVEMNVINGLHYYELAAMGGVVAARLALGLFEDQAGNLDRALKHYMVAAGNGHNRSVKNIRQLYMNGHATKEDYANALRARQAYLEEIKSKQRDEAAAAHDEYKYY